MAAQMRADLDRSGKASFASIAEGCTRLEAAGFLMFTLKELSSGRCVASQAGPYQDIVITQPLPQSSPYEASYASITLEEDFSAIVHSDPEADWAPR